MFEEIPVVLRRKYRLSYGGGVCLVGNLRVFDFFFFECFALYIYIYIYANKSVAFVSLSLSSFLPNLGIGQKVIKCEEMPSVCVCIID